MDAHGPSGLSMRSSAGPTPDYPFALLTWVDEAGFPIPRRGDA